ncbi:hypothetical protein QAD02_011530 [Eretmocerus hayati]|uniref:Uncharacterized protein n=1 Tax=Eretmocerus hayati TaxID=131215 RepID=A0ACC2NWU2_9HYME|nr:hypothetical protein QAD02_011530 [Eretmocerus hayati]
MGNNRSQQSGTCHRESVSHEDKKDAGYGENDDSCPCGHQKTKKNKRHKNCQVNLDDRRSSAPVESESNVRARVKELLGSDGSCSDNESDKVSSKKSSGKTCARKQKVTMQVVSKDDAAIEQDQEPILKTVELVADFLEILERIFVFVITLVVEVSKRGKYLHVSSLLSTVLLCIKC